jgi:Dolichyl-phosphate-mannose-protein mannosyltransferase
MTISVGEEGVGGRGSGVGDSQAMPFSRTGRLTAIALAAVTLAMRAVAFFHYRFDSDEPQHLHVAWGWTVGLLQYRDLFDNHAPLFHMASAPLLRLLGERPDILLFMRVPMVVLWLIVSVATFAIARRLYDGRVAVWSTLLLNVIPPFFLKSLEFRTDNLWNTFWMVAVAALLLGEPSTASFLLAGLLLGCALAVSLKTSLLLITLAGAAALTYFMCLRERGIAIRARHIAAMAVGIVIVPALVVAYFLERGAWADFVYCVFRFNELVALTRSQHLVWIPRLLYVPLMIILVRVAWRYRRTTTSVRFFFAVATAIFVVTLGCFWILISPRDFLPLFPFAAIFIVAPLARGRHFVKVMAVISIVCLIAIGYYSEWLTNQTREFITMESQLLRLTRPGELVMDYKGEMIYRRRPYYLILEYITRNAIAHGLLKDTVPEDLVRTGCHVAQADGTQWPDRARDFMRTYFINVGRLRVSGQWLQPDGSFTIGVPGDYVILTKRGHAAGSLDGTPYQGARRLAAGTHRFAGAHACKQVACLWAPAYARGFSPFHLQDLDF